MCHACARWHVATLLTVAASCRCWLQRSSAVSGRTSSSPPSPALHTQDLPTEGYVAKKMERRIDAVLKYVLVSGKKALEDAGLAMGSDQMAALDKMRAGILVGSAFGGMQTFATAVEALETQGGGGGCRGSREVCMCFAVLATAGRVQVLCGGLVLCSALCIVPACTPSVEVAGIMLQWCLRQFCLCSMWP